MERTGVRSLAQLLFVGAVDWCSTVTALPADNVGGAPEAPTRCGQRLR
jgi:hypothetical protein